MYFRLFKDSEMEEGRQLRVVLGRVFAASSGTPSRVIGLREGGASPEAFLETGSGGGDCLASF